MVNDFLRSTREGLEELVLLGPYSSLASVIASDHGRSLKRLSIHDPERTYTDSQRNTMKIDDLLTLGTTCEVLESLELDVDSLVISSNSANPDISVGVGLANLFSLTAHSLVPRSRQPSLKARVVHRPPLFSD